MTRSDGDSTRMPHFVRMLCLVFVVAALIPAVGWAQDGSTTEDFEGSVFAPFVSRLRLSMRDPEVRLTWEDSNDIEGTYRIYRHTEEITASTFLQAQLVAEVESGVQSFIDTPAEPGDYYYAVLAQSAAGELFEIFIAYRNSTFAAVTVENVATLVERSARVREIEALEADGVILVEYESDQTGRELIIYRSTRPLTTAEDLLSAGVVATVMSSVESVTDYPVPGVPYFYAVVDSALVAEGSATFTAGVNTTATAVEVPLQAIASTAQPEPEPEPAPVADEPADEPVEEEPVSVGVTQTAPEPEVVAVTTTVEAEPQEDLFVPEVSRRRPLPLPFLQLNTNLQTGTRLGDTAITVPERQLISTRTQDAVDSMLAGLAQQPNSAAAPEILSEDQLPSPRGAEFTLRTILDGPFADLAWEEALGQLSNVLSLPLSPAIRSRALFYRAQCFYFNGQTERAFVEFLLARDDYFVEVEGWLDVILSDQAGA